MRRHGSLGCGVAHAQARTQWVNNLKRDDKKLGKAHVRGDWVYKWEGGIGGGNAQIHFRYV